MNRKSAIPISALISFTTITLANIQNNDRLPGPREMLGFVVVYTILSAGADLNIPVAGGFAILVMITVLLTRGYEALQFVTGKIGTPKKHSKKQGGAKGTVPLANPYEPQKA